MNDELLDSILREAVPAADLSLSPSEDLADQVRRRHLKIQRRRRFARSAAGAMMCYAVGMLTMWFWMKAPAGPVRVTAVRQERSVAEVTSSNPPEHVDDEPGSGHSSEEPHAAVLATQIGSPYQALRALGDRYLLQQGKVDLALDVYSRALDQATEAETAISYEHDSWLLISLKRDRLVSSL
jgi:hypothetical protein